MHIVIINASPLNAKKSMTTQVLEAFKLGILEKSSTVETYELCNRSLWKDAKQAILNNTHIIFVTPVYWGIVPSMFIEFFEELNRFLPEENRIDKNISYILQSAFPESKQRECCENYLESFVMQLQCTFKGTLSHSVYYDLIEPSAYKGLSEEYKFFGKRYIENNATFFFKEVDEFNGVECLTEQQAKKFIRGFNFMCKHIAHQNDDLIDLYNNPYKK